MNLVKNFLKILIIIFVLSGCGQQKNDNEILIGEYSSLTGTTASFGQSIHKGLVMAIDEINKAGGVLNGKMLKLITEDTQSRPEEAASAVSKLINRDRVVAIFGEGASSRSLAGAPICQAAGIPMISPASTNPEVTKKGDYIFRVCFIDPFQGTVLAKFAFNSLKVKRVVILKDVKNDYSIGLANYFKETFEKLGGKILAEQAYSEGDTDFKAQLTALKTQKPDVIFLPGYYSEVALIVKQARELNMNMPFIGGDGWDSVKLLEIGGSALNGCYFSNHYSSENPEQQVQNFVKAFKSKFANETPDVTSALGYDAVKVLVDALKRSQSADPKKVKAALAKTKNFVGVTGKISIDNNRNAAKSAVILEIKNNKIIYKETILP